MKNFSLIITTILIILASCKCEDKQCGKWSEERAWEWQRENGWLAGCNFIPSTAVNQLEMWQAETFDPATIDRELGFAENIGLNCMRVYLHHAAWEIDRKGFKSRLKKYLDISDKHHIKNVFVLMDDCWNPTYATGSQPEPKPGIHNSGWLQDPGEIILGEDSLTITNTLKEYVKDVMTAFKNDKRVVMWDLYNEPGNSGYETKSLPLLEKVFAWAREVCPSQPITAGVWTMWHTFTPLVKFQIENSDVITYHQYEKEEYHQSMIDTLKKINRPMVCTEYLARQNNSTPLTITPMLHRQNIGAINWGLVAGKTQTNYLWNTPVPDGSEPPLWGHDLFRRDGTPYINEEIEVFKKLTGKKE
jgi:hypothetical protein